MHTAAPTPCISTVSLVASVESAQGALPLPLCSCRVQSPMTLHPTTVLWYLDGTLESQRQSSGRQRGHGCRSEAAGHSIEPHNVPWVSSVGLREVDGREESGRRWC